MRWAIDAGHGGNDSGAVGPTNLEEADVVLDISRLVEAGLQSLGQEVLLTRPEDKFVELGKRCQLSNDWDADYFVSIHANSNGSTAVGIETLYKTGDGHDLAVPIQTTLIDMTNDVDRGLKERNDLYVLNGTYCPAALTEVGFITHPETEQKLKTENYRLVLAHAIVTGIGKFLGIEPPKLA